MHGRSARVSSGGIDNISCGTFAQSGSGTGNICIGKSTGNFNLTGSTNTIIGYQAASDITTGGNNLLLGVEAGNATSPGGVVITTQSNQIVLGNNSITNARIQVAFTVTSDARDKMDFNEVPHGLAFVEQLEPISYRFKKSRDEEITHGPQHYGFKAQDILALEGDSPVIINNENEEHLGYSESHLIPVLVNSIKELSAMVKQLQQEVAELKK